MRQYAAMRLFEQKGNCAHVPRGSAGVGQRAGVFIYAHQQQGCLQHRKGSVVIAGSSIRIMVVAPTRWLTMSILEDVITDLVVVNDMHGCMASHAFKRDQRLSVNQGDSIDVLRRQIAWIQKRQLSSIQVEEGAHVAVHAARQNRLAVE